MILPAQSYLITRRVRDRTHLFRPDAAIRQTFMYCLFVAAQPLGIEVHAAILMSNHHHVFVTDPHGHVCRFMTRFHLLMAKCTKALRRWQGTVYEDADASLVALLTPEALVEKMAYVIANPVEAQLVEKATQWPGLSAWRNRPDKRWAEVQKPEVYFRKRNKRLPKTVTPVFTLPALLVNMYGQRRAVVAINNQIRRIERQAQAERVRTGKSALGAHNVLKGSTHDRASSEEPPVSLNPHFAVGRGQRATHQQAARTLKAFRDAYKKAFRQWRRGNRSVCFPPGTFWMVYVHGADTPG